MKQKHLLTLLREDFTTIGVVFAGMSIDAPGAPASPPNMPQPVPAPWARDEDKAHAQRMELNRTYGKFGSPRTPVASMYTGASYTYKIKRGTGVRWGDNVVVQSTNGKLRVGTVVEVHDTPQIDLDSDISYKWIVQLVDMKPYERLQEEEAEFMRLAEVAEREHQRQLLLGKFTEHLPEGSVGRQLFEEAVAKFRTGNILNAPAAPSNSGS